MPAKSTAKTPPLLPEGLPRGMAQLTPRRQDLIRPVFAQPRNYVLMSVRDLAAKLGTDPATTVRIVQRLGFRSYREFQHYLHELSLARATPLNTMRAGTDAGATPAVRLRRALELESRNVGELANVLDFDRLLEAGAKLWPARRIVVVGGDLATSLVYYLEYHLSVIGLAAITATAPGLAVHQVRSLDARDVLIAISFRRGLKMTVQALQAARRQGAYCIGVTDNSISPVARLSHQCFIASVESESFVSSYAGPIALLSLLLSACAEARRDEILRWMKKVETEQRTGFRWHQE